MHEHLTTALQDLGTEAPALEEAATRSKNLINESRGFLQAQLADVDGVDVVVLGSLGRLEATPVSDLDYLIVVHELLSPVTAIHDVIEAVEQLRIEKLELREPGPTGTFGRVIGAPDLVEVIGLDEDTNRTHTHRMLLLMESASILREQLRARLVAAILERYLADYEVPKRGVPRFLLNDVLRYWRTLAVDYQAKKWSQLQPEWGWRYLKLIIPRKLAVSGTVMSLFLCEEATVDHFAAQFDLPPLARLAQVHPLLKGEGEEALIDVLSIAESFAVRAKDPAFRAMAASVGSRADAKEQPAFTAAVDEARRLQKALEVIFFDNEHLRPKARKYLSF